jgi:ATP-dependent Lon protease
MGSNSGKTTKLPLVPLAKDTVLLPGVTLRIPLTNRPDLANFLASFLNRSKREQGPITLGCVPLASPRLSTDGQQLIEDGGSDSQNEEYETVDAGQARKEDLFKYGTVAKLIGVQRRVYPEPYLLVEGVRRFTVVKLLRDRPFFEAEVVLQDEPGTSIKGPWIRVQN